MFDWLKDVPVEVWGLVLLVLAVLAGLAGRVVRLRLRRQGMKDEDEQEGYVVSGVLGLLALLMGFSLAMAVDRFDVRRVLVVQEANAIGTAYLRSQLLPQPHRARLSQLLVDYTDNRIALATHTGGDRGRRLLARNDQLLTEMWAATAAGFDAVSNLDFSSTLVEGMNNVIESDALRKASRFAHIPTEVLVLLALYLLVAAGILGYVLDAPRSQVSGIVVIALFGSSLVLILDLDGAKVGGIQELQAPMERLLDTLKAQPPQAFDRWRGPNP